MSSALRFTSKEKLNTELSWEIIDNKTQADFLGLTLSLQIATFKTRTLIRTCLSKRKDNPNAHRSGSFMQLPYFGEKYAKSFFLNFTKQYNSLISKTRRLIPEYFSLFIAKKMKHKKFKRLSYGQSNHSNLLLIRIKIGYS